MSAVAVRSLQVEDAAPVAVLLTQLGYPTTGVEARERIAFALKEPRTTTLVACDGNEVVGLVAARFERAIEKSDPFVHILLLVVHEKSRGLGIGKRLMAEIDQWARTHGAAMLMLTSGNARAEAHAFYRGLGYEGNGVRFVKRF